MVKYTHVILDIESGTIIKLFTSKNSNNLGNLLDFYNSSGVGIYRTFCFYDFLDFCKEYIIDNDEYTSYLWNYSLLCSGMSAKIEKMYKYGDFYGLKLLYQTIIPMEMKEKYGQLEFKKTIIN